MVQVPTDIFFYDQFWAFPQISPEKHIEVNLKSIFEKLGILLINKMTILMPPSYEKYLADLIGAKYYELVSYPPEKGYDSAFKMVKYNKLNHKLYEKDTIYVCDKGNLVVVYNKDTALKLRKIRGNNE